MTEHTGGCACGNVRFKVSGPFMGVGVCHCTDCQKASGGAPNYVALAPKGGFEVTQGQPKLYIKKGESGGDVGRAFCADCGTPLWSELVGAPFQPVKLGALDDNAELKPALHLYTESAPPWHLLHDGIPAFPKAVPGS